MCTTISSSYGDSIVKNNNTEDIKLIKLTTEAFEKEVFGTPTFIINNKIFWGQDRFEYALEELKN